MPTGSPSTPPRRTGPAADSYLYDKSLLHYPIVTTSTRGAVSGEGGDCDDDDLSTMSPLTIPSVLFDAGSCRDLCSTPRSRLGYRGGGGGGGGLASIGEADGQLFDLDDSIQDQDDDNHDGHHDKVEGSGDADGNDYNVAAINEEAGRETTASSPDKKEGGGESSYSSYPIPVIPEERRRPDYILNRSDETQSIVSEIYDEHTPLPHHQHHHHDDDMDLHHHHNAVQNKTDSINNNHHSNSPGGQTYSSPDQVTAFPHSPQGNESSSESSGWVSSPGQADSFTDDEECNDDHDDHDDHDRDREQYSNNDDDHHHERYENANDQADDNKFRDDYFFEGDAISRARADIDASTIATTTNTEGGGAGRLGARAGGGEDEGDCSNHHHDEEEHSSHHQADFDDAVSRVRDDLNAQYVEVHDDGEDDDDDDDNDDDTTEAELGGRGGRAGPRAGARAGPRARARARGEDEFDDAVSAVRAYDDDNNAEYNGDNDDGYGDERVHEERREQEGEEGGGKFYHHREEEEGGRVGGDSFDDEVDRVLSELGVYAEGAGRPKEQQKSITETKTGGRRGQRFATEESRAASRASRTSTERVCNTEAQRLNKLGADLLSKGRTEEALSIYRRAINSGRSDIARMKNKIAVLRRNDSLDSSSARRHAEEIQRLKAATVSVAATVADVLNNMGVAYEMKCWYDAAISSCENALDMYVNACHRREGTGDRDVDQTMQNIVQMEFARATHAQRVKLHGRADELAEKAAVAANVSSKKRKALRHEREAVLTSVLKLERDSLGPNHPGVAQTLLQRGVLHQDMGNDAVAVKEVKHAVSIYRNSLGDSHPDVGRAFVKLAAVYEERDATEIIEADGMIVETTDKDRALSLYRKAARVLRGSIGNGSEVGGILNSIGAVYTTQGEYGKAMEAFSAASAAYGGRSRQIRTAQGRCETSTADTSKHHPGMAKVWNNIGEVLAKKKEWEKALDAFEFALVVIVQSKKRRPAAPSSGASRSRNENQGVIHRSNSDVSEMTTEEYLASQEPQRNELEDGLLMAATLQNIGNVQTELGWHGKSMGSYEEALRITQMCAKRLQCGQRGFGDRRSKHDNISMDTIRIFEKMGEVMENCGDLQAAMGLYTKCLSLHRHSGGDNYTAFASLLSKIASVHMKNCDYDEALDILEECVQLYQTNGLPRDHPELLTVNTLHREAEQAVRLTVASMAGSSRNRSNLSGSSRSQRSLSSGGSVDLAFAFDKKAEALRKSGNYDEAMEACMEALKIRRAKAAAADSDDVASGRSSVTSMGRNLQQIDVARTLRNMAFLHTKRMEYDKAKSLYTECISIYKINGLDRAHPYVVAAMKELKTLQRMTGGDDPVERCASSMSQRSRSNFMGAFKSSR